jgi:hypothetical protein
MNRNAHLKISEDIDKGASPSLTTSPRSIEAENVCFPRNRRQSSF